MSELRFISKFFVIVNMAVLIHIFYQRKLGFRHLEIAPFLQTNLVQNGFSVKLDLPILLHTGQTWHWDLGGTAIRGWAYYPRIVGSIPALTAFEDSIPWTRC